VELCPAPEGSRNRKNVIGDDCRKDRHELL
jgi:hypothetical protein